MKLLIIDDEIAVRKSVMLMVDLKALGFNEILEAGDGKRGLELIKSEKPNVVITDMKMPEMDGVSLLTSLEKTNENFKIIVISGFTDFEYTRVAIRSKVIDYLLKPIKKEELLKAFQKALDEIKNSDLDEEPNNTIDKAVRQLSILRKGKYGITKDKLDKYLEDKQPGVGFDICKIIVFKFINFEEVKNARFCGYSELVLYSLEEIITNYSGRWIAQVSFEPIQERNEIMLLIYFKNEESKNIKNRIVDDVEGLMDYFTNKYSLNCFAVLSMDMLPGFSVFNDYKKISHILCNYNILSSEKVISMEEDINLYELGRHSLVDFRDGIIAAAKNCDEKAFEENISDIFARIFESCNISINELDFICIEFINILYGAFNNIGMDMDELLSNNTEVIDFMKYSGDLLNIKKWMLNLAAWSISCISSAKKESFNTILGDILKYIDKYFYEKIDLTLLSKKFYLSKEHISRVFKKELGENFVDYITKVRLNKAVELLGDHELKLRSISDMTGFCDVSYFSKQFKKQFNVSPEEFRQLKSRQNIKVK